MPFSYSWLGGQLLFTQVLHLLLMMALGVSAQQQQNATIQCAPTEGLFELHVYWKGFSPERSIINWMLLDRSGLDVAKCDDRSLCQNQCSYDDSHFSGEELSISLQQCLPLLDQRSNSSEDGCYKLVIGNRERPYYSDGPISVSPYKVAYFNASFNNKTIANDTMVPEPTKFFPFGNEGNDDSSCSKNTGCDDGQSLLELLMFEEKYPVFYNWTDDDDANADNNNTQNKQQLSVYGKNAAEELCPTPSNRPHFFVYHKTCIAMEACLNVTVDVAFVRSIKAVLDGVVHKEDDHSQLDLTENFNFLMGARGSCSADIICDVSRGEKLVEIEFSTQRLDNDLGWSLSRGYYYHSNGYWSGERIVGFGYGYFITSQPGEVYRHLECVVDDRTSCVAFIIGGNNHHKGGESIVYSVWVDGESVVENGIICEESESCFKGQKFTYVNLFGKCRRPLSVGAIVGIVVGTLVLIVVCARVWAGRQSN